LREDTFRKPRHRWRHNIKIDFKKCNGGMVWIGLAEDRDRWQAVFNAVMNIRVLYNAAKFLTS
jgi:hypothetical protein